MKPKRVCWIKSCRFCKISCQKESQTRAGPLHFSNIIDKKRNDFPLSWPGSGIFLEKFRSGLSGVWCVVPLSDWGLSLFILLWRCRGQIGLQDISLRMREFPRLVMRYRYCNTEYTFYSLWLHISTISLPATCNWHMSDHRLLKCVKRWSSWRLIFAMIVYLSVAQNVSPRNCFTNFSVTFQ